MLANKIGGLMADVEEHTILRRGVSFHGQWRGRQYRGASSPRSSKIGAQNAAIRALEISASPRSASVNRKLRLWVIQRGRVELIKFEIGNPAACAPRHSNAIARRNIRIGGVLINFEHRRLPVPLLLRGRFQTVLYFGSIPTRQQPVACPAGQFCQKQSDQPRCCAPAREYSDGSAPCPPAWFLLLYRWRRRHEEYDGDYVHLHESDGSFLRHSAECGYQTTPLVD